MRGIKIPQYEFALKMQGSLCAKGGVFAGHYGNLSLLTMVLCSANDLCTFLPVSPKQPATSV